MYDLESCYNTFFLGPKPKIEVSEMDGRNRQSIITEGVFWPNGLALDYAIDRLYWTDAKHHAIESAKLDGSDRRKVLRQLCDTCNVMVKEL